MLCHEVHESSLSKEQTRAALLGIREGGWLHFTRSVDRQNFMRAFRDYRFAQKDTSTLVEGIRFFSVQIPAELQEKLNPISFLSLLHTGAERYGITLRAKQVEQRRTVSFDADQLLARAVGIYSVHGQRTEGMVAFAREADAKRLSDWLTSHIPGIQARQEQLPPTAEGKTFPVVSLPIEFTREVLFPYIESARRFGIHGQRTETIMRENAIVSNTIKDTLKANATQRGR